MLRNDHARLSRRDPGARLAGSARSRGSELRAGVDLKGAHGAALALAALLLALVASGCRDPQRFTVMTMNAGTTTGLPHDLGEAAGRGDGYTSELAAIADDLYENSLSWNPAEQALAGFIARHRPDIVAFQEIYFDPWCETIPVDPSLDFVCRGYGPSRPLQVERLVGPGYQVACAVDQEDNCVALRRDLGRFEGCPDQGPCLGGLEGMGPPDGCSRGARIGSVEVVLHDGRRFTLVNVHASSGFAEKDMRCRVSQLEQIFVDRGDGRPAANGERNLVVGDINTDPFLFAGFDPSAGFWNRWVGEGRPFRYLSSGPGPGPATYAGLARIDHVVSDAFEGSCEVPGSTPGLPPIFDAIYWDHRPVGCELRW